jgi:hypothetical protein
MNFENVYWDQRALDDDARSASIVAIGDSWFWYPFPGGSLLNSLGPLVEPKEHVILAFGNNGAEAFDYVNGVYRDSVETGLKFHGGGLSAVFISGGGNDFAGFNDLRPLLKFDCSQFKTARGCYRTGNDTGTLEWLMDRTESSLDTLINKVFLLARAGTKIILHTYDYPYPSGKGVFGGKGAWLKPALDDAKVSASLQRGCMVYLIDQFAKRQQNLVSKYPDRVFLVDSRGALADSNWANELHPKPAGFRTIAQNCWLPVLEETGLA